MVLIVVDSIMQIDEQTHGQFFHSMCDLKAIQMNIQLSLIWEIILYKFKLGYNTQKTTKNIFCAKGEGAVDCSTVTT